MAVALLVSLQDDVVREKYPSGRVKLEYRVDAKGAKHGSYAEFYESGQKKLVTTYFHGDPDGMWDEYAEAGKIVLRKRYAKGVLRELTRLEPDGRPLHQVTFKDGVVTLGVPGGKAEDAYPRSKRAIREEIPKIEGTPWDPKEPPYEEEYSIAAPHKAGKLKAEYLADALRHHKAYRWLSELHTDVALDPALTECAQHGAVVMGAVNNLTHTPQQPADMDKAFFDKGYRGTSGSNIAGGRTLRMAVNMFMHDSDPSNIDRVGHRVWMLNPRMGKTGFGQVSGYIAQWSTDASSPAPKPDVVRYPSRGWFPTDYLADGVAWSVTIHADRWQVPKNKGGLKVRMWTLNDEYDIAGEVKLDYYNLSGRTAIFRPVLEKREGTRVLVQIAGVKQGKDDASILYITELFALDSGK